MPGPGLSLAMPGPVFLRGERVELCTLEEDDIAFVHGVLNDPRVRSPVGHEGPTSRAQERAWFEEVGPSSESVQLLITAGGERLGVVELDPVDDRQGQTELAFYLDPDAQGQGYASEAVSLVVTYAFEERRMHRVYAEVFGFNEGSKRLLTRLGFREEGVHTGAAFVDGEYVDVHHFAVLAEEWTAR
jgi:RimJ/RimL family protein N-acetyltransferase